MTYVINLNYIGLTHILQSSEWEYDKMLDTKNLEESDGMKDVNNFNIVLKNILKLLKTPVSYLL